MAGAGFESGHFVITRDVEVRRNMPYITPQQLFITDTIVALELTITAKGQVTLRQAVLDHMNVKAGQKVGVSLLPDGRVELTPAETNPDIRSLRGALHRPGQRRVSIEEMQEAIEAVAPR
jgi:hypothetical protein